MYSNLRPATSAFKPLSLALLASIWLVLLPNWPLWRAFTALPEMAGARGALFIGAFGVIVACLLYALLALFAWRWSIKPAITLLLLAAALGAHFMGAYNIVIDAEMIANTLQTDVRETRDLLNWRLAASVLLLAVLPLVWLWRVPVLAAPRLVGQLWRNLAAIAGALALIVVLIAVFYADFSSTMRNHKPLRYLINPLNSFYGLATLARDTTSRKGGEPVAVGLDARLLAQPPGSKPPLLLLVVGETARSDHFALNGYPRPTNPELTKHGVVSYTQVMSCGTSTATSLPCMFSHLGKTAYEDRTQNAESLLDILQRAGLAVLWLDNQSGCKGVCDRVPNAHARQLAPGAAPPPAGLCNGGECFDLAMLHGLDERLAALPAEHRARGVVLVLHQMGSHGPAYFKRSPQGRKPFLPECTTNVLQQCDKAELINAYDNSIAYTDHLLGQSINWLQQQTSHAGALLYVSDHGESLGENNLYLHGLPYAFAPKAQKHVPWITWLSPQLQTQAALPSSCLTAQQGAALTHDHLSHSVLGLMGVQTSLYQTSLDVYAACRVGR